jgi:hypothetical protein
MSEENPRQGVYIQRILQHCDMLGGDVFNDPEHDLPHQPDARHKITNVWHWEDVDNKLRSLGYGSNASRGIARSANWQ